MDEKVECKCFLEKRGRINSVKLYFGKEAEDRGKDERAGMTKHEK